MLSLSGAFAIGVCAAALCACGSTSNREAIITTALRKLQAEYAHAERAASSNQHSDAEEIVVALPAPPPKGVTGAEWQAAIKNDRTLQRKFSSQTK